MSYTFKVVTTDGQYYNVPDYNSLSFGGDFDDVQAISFKYPYGGINADKINTQNAVLIAYWNNVELRNSRYVIMVGQGDDDPTQQYFTVSGRNLLDVLRKVIVRNPAGPATSYLMKTSTAGGILDRLFKDAQARGAMTGITWKFTSANDSLGKPWASSITIEYKPGAMYKDIVTNLVENTMCDFYFQGNELVAVNPDSASVDHTVTAPIIELRAGRDYQEMPSKWSVEDRVQYSLLIGNDSLFVEDTHQPDNEPSGPYGREEQSVSQGSMNDPGSMSLVNQALLNQASKTVREYTRKVVLRDDSYVPFVDYQQGDWIFDRVSVNTSNLASPGSTFGLPTRYRIVNITCGVNDQGNISSVALVLNDRLQEADIRIAKKVNGIIGGGSAGGTSGGIPTTDQTDKTIPSVPTGVLSTSDTYLDAFGNTLGVASTSWLNPQTNTDGSAITDLSHFEIEHNFTGTLTYAAPITYAGMKPANDLMHRFDRRGITTPGWTGADGGGNWAADDTTVFHCWGDSMWGTLDPKGNRVNTYMPRNTMTSFQPSNANQLDSYAGVENIVPLAVARGDDTTPWTIVGNCTIAVSTAWANALNGKCIEMTSTAAGITYIDAYVTRTTSQGSTYKPIRGGKTYRLMGEIDPTSTLTSSGLAVYWYDTNGANVGLGSAISSATSYDVMITAPATAVTALVQVRFTAGAAGQKFRFTRLGLFETTHQMQNWRLPAPNYTVKNLVTNPDGAASSGTTVARKNYVTNPGMYVDASGYVAQGGAALVRDLAKVHGQPDGAPQVAIQNPAVLAKWQTAVAARTTKQANWVVVGTSVSSGLTTTNFHNRYQTRLFDMLRRYDYPTTGVMPNNNKNGYQGMEGFIPGFYTADPYCPSLPGPNGQGKGGTHNTGVGLGGQTLALEAGSYRRFTATFDTFTMQYASDATWGGKLQITVDGVIYPLIDCAVAGTSSTPKLWNLPTALPLGEHVIEITNPTPPGSWGNAYVCGFDFYAGDKGKGIHVLDGAQSGWSANAFATYAAPLANSIAQMTPNLVSIEFGYNDAASKTSAQFKTDLQTCITALKTACTAAGVTLPAILLIGGYNPSTGTPSGWTEPWANYLTQMKAIATADPTNVAFVDLSTVMPILSTDTTGLYDGAIHPSDKGHALIADILRGVVAPVSTANKKGSLRVTPVAATAASGMSIPYAPAADWPVGTPWVYTAWVKGPAGAKLSIYSGSPPNTTAAAITLSGDWQRWTQSGTVGAGATTGPQLVIRTADTTQASFDFWVTDIQLEQGATPTDYFDGESGAEGDEVVAWTGTRYLSQSTASLQIPANWAVSGGTTSISKSVTRPNGNPTCVRLARSGTSNLYMDVTFSAPANTPITAAAWVMSPAGGTVHFNLQSNGTILITGPIITLTPGVWTEVRIEGTPTAASNLLLLTCTSDLYYVSELTGVLGAWSGGTFTGNSKNTQGITCTWDGVANASTSTAVYPNSNYVELGYNFFGDISTADRVVQLFQTSGLPGGNSAEWCWPADGCYSTGNKALVVYESVISDASIQSGWNFAYNGSFWIAEFDLAAKKFIRARLLGRDPRGGKQCISWGGAMMNDGGYVYIFGSRSTGATMNNYVVRATVANAYSGPYDVYTSTGWVTAPANTDLGQLELGTGLPIPAVIGVTPDAGFSAVRKMGTAYKAMAVGGFQHTLDIWTAAAPSGPWTKEYTAYTFPNPNYLYYSAKFQQGTDENGKGDCILVCQSTGDSILNPSYYLPLWLRGPKGAITANSGAGSWGFRQSIDGSPAPYYGLTPGSVYQARVRAVDQANPPHVSAWTTGTPIRVGTDATGPNQPSTPLVSTQFRGVRIEWDGLDTNGNVMPPDYGYYEVHMSTTSAFTPIPQTRVDWSPTKGGVSSIQELAYDTTYFVKIVAYDRLDNPSVPSQPGSGTAERLSDPDLAANLITNAKLPPNVVTASNLTVSAFGDNLVPQGNMEEATSTGAVAGWTGYFSTDPLFDTVSPIAGHGSMRFDVPASTDAGATTYTALSRAVPISPASIYYVAAKLRTSRKLNSAQVQVVLSVADTEEHAGAGFGQDQRFNISVTNGGVDLQTVEGNAEIPWDDTICFGRICLIASPDTYPYTVWFDDVELRKIVGGAAIANASIDNAKIRNLAVDDAKISSLSVGKLVTGILQADVTVSARIKTADTGKRVELNLNGLQAYNSVSDLVTQVTTDGGLISKYIRTNTSGARIELGTYASGADSANIAFFDSTTTWQFPPVMGYGGGGSVNYPGVAMHAGSRSLSDYNTYGMSMIGLDQKGGIGIITGMKLDGTESTTGAGFTLNVGGSSSGIYLATGGAEPAILNMSPTPRASYLTLGGGKLYYGALYTDFQTNQSQEAGTAWNGFDIYHLVHTADRGVRFVRLDGTDMFSIHPNGDLNGSGDWGVPKIRTRDTGYYVSWDSSGTLYKNGVSAKTFVIDHPVDKDKYLVHATVEQPEARVAYEGNAHLVPAKTMLSPAAPLLDKTLLGDNEVEIPLPSYFAALVDESTVSIQITPYYDACGPDCQYHSAPSLAAKYITGGKFRVKAVGGVYHPDVHFGWRVSAVRKDIPKLVAEPTKATTKVKGDGPYTYVANS